MNNWDAYFAIIETVVLVLLFVWFIFDKPWRKNQ
jgi:hypothetical protein